MTVHTRVCSRHFKSSDYFTSLTGRKRNLKPTAVPSIFFWKQGSPVKRKSPKKRSPVKRKIVAKGSETSTANAANANTNSMWGLVTAAAINKKIDKTSEVLEVHDRGTQDESMSELKKEIEELKNKLQEEKEKTNALVIQLNEMKQQLVHLTTRWDNFEKKSFPLNWFKNDKSMGFYTGFYNALYNFCDSGEDGENIRYWHSSSTDQDMTVLRENDEHLESFPKPGRPRLLHPTEELFITLCRLRQGFPEEHLAYLYGVSQTTCTISRIIITSGSEINFFLRETNLKILVARWKGLVTKSKCYCLVFFFFLVSCLPRQDRGFAS